MIIQNFTNQAVHVALPAVGGPSASIAVEATSKSSPVFSNVAKSAPVTPRQASSEELKNAVSVINQAMRQSNSSLQFSMDIDTHTPVVRLVDINTGELIRQIPSEETLAISRSLDQVLQRQGLLFKQVT